jgi:hypothetical protein
VKETTVDVSDEMLQHLRAFADMWVTDKAKAEAAKIEAAALHRQRIMVEADERKRQETDVECARLVEAAKAEAAQIILAAHPPAPAPLETRTPRAPLDTRTTYETRTPRGVPRPM